jgi:hypothetical protein
MNIVQSNGKMGTKMKYIILSVTILFSVAWYWIQSSNSAKSQSKKVQIHGKVQGLQGTIVLNIEDKLLTLSPYDRFTFQLHTAFKEELNMQLLINLKINTAI